jgi:hypothetical protein
MSAVMRSAQSWGVTAIIMLTNWPLNRKAGYRKTGTEQAVSRTGTLQKQLKTGRMTQ